jgi:hypothetical protein
MLARITDQVLVPARDLALDVVGKVVNGVIGQVDMNALLAKVDINAIIQQVDLNTVMQNVDLNSLMDNVDIAALLEKVDIDSIMARTEMGSLIVRSTSGVAGEALDVVRSGAVGIDGAIGRTVDRVFRRRSNGD